MKKSQKYLIAVAYPFVREDCNSGRLPVLSRGCCNTGNEPIVPFVILAVEEETSFGGLLERAIAGNISE